MATWGDVVDAAPEFAAKIRASFEAGRHFTIATLRADGSPRISGIECEFDDQRLRFGSMLDARKLTDLRRDGRFALHGPTSHPERGGETSWEGEAKVSGRAFSDGMIFADETGDEPQGEWFAADIESVSFTGLNEDATMLSIEFWTPDGGLQRVVRS